MSFFGWRGCPEARRTEIRDRRLRVGRRSWGRDSSYEVWESCKLPQRGSGQSPDAVHFGPTKSLENASSVHKYWSQFTFFTEHPAEPLDTTGRTLRFCRTPVEKHCSMSMNSSRDGTCPVTWPLYLYFVAEISQWLRFFIRRISTIR